MEGNGSPLHSSGAKQVGQERAWEVVTRRRHRRGAVCRHALSGELAEAPAKHLSLHYIGKRAYTAIAAAHTLDYAAASPSRRRSHITAALSAQPSRSTEGAAAEGLRSEILLCCV